MVAISVAGLPAGLGTWIGGFAYSNVAATIFLGIGTGAVSNNATLGIDVINMSLGASSWSRGEAAAVQYAWSHGAILVAARGLRFPEALEPHRGVARGLVLVPEGRGIFADMSVLDNLMA